MSCNFGEMQESGDEVKLSARENSLNAEHPCPKQRGEREGAAGTSCCTRTDSRIWPFDHVMST